MILPLEDPAASDPKIAGGKASTLARLRRAGFPVPDGCVVTEPVDAGSEVFAARVRDLAAAAGPDTRFAVRSSGHAEDSADASFAGQYETVLDVAVDDLPRAVAQCFASFAGAQARAYQERRGVAGAGGAVLVQQMIPAEAAGVAFTMDPVSGDRTRIVIDAAPGLGTAVVGGRVTPDGFTVSKETGIIAERRQAGTAAAIDDDVVRAVAGLARRVEAHEQRPVDIEWAAHAGTVYLLQSRPITSWVPELNTAIDPRFPLYSSGNVSEILPAA